MLTMRNERVNAGSLLLVVTALVLAAGLFVAYGFHSYHPTDQGYVLGYAWRWVGGQTPYVDFVYRRPPGSFLLHSIWFALPDGWVLLGSRAGYYLQVTLGAAALFVAALRAGIVRSPLRLALLGTAFTLIAQYLFPVMVWYTVDGAFFSSIGLAALILSNRAQPMSRSVAYRALASFSFCAAPLCKQTFVFVALAFALLATAELAMGRRRGDPDAGPIFAASSLPALSLVALFSLWLAAEGSLVAMLEQAVFPGTSSRLFRIGFELYWGSSRVWLIVPGVVWAWVALREADRWPWLAHACGTAALIGLAYDLSRNLDIGRSLVFLLTGIAIGRITARLAPGRRTPADPAEHQRILFTFGVLLIAWTTSLAFGIRNPLIGLAGMAVAIDDLIPLPKKLHFGLALVLPAVLVAAALAATSYKQLRKPYFELPVRVQNHVLEDIAPRYGRITTNGSTARHMRELVELIERHALARNRDFVVLDQFPLIHYVLDRQNPALMDWYLAFEMPGMKIDTTAQLLALDAVFILHRRKGVSILGYVNARKGDCALSDFDHSPFRKKPIFVRGRLLESTPLYCVVELPRKKADGR